MAKLPKGSAFGIRKTAGRNPGSYDLFEIRGLSLGKLEMIRNALAEYVLRKGSILAQEMLPDFQRTLEENPHQTISS